jgi:cytochrome b6-f complex iron-sulfur subunit
MLRTAFWAATAGGLGGGAVGVCRYLGTPAPSRVVRVPPELLPAAGALPRAVPAGHFFLVHLAPDEPLGGGHFEPVVATPGGFLVLSSRGWLNSCTDRGIEWVPSFRRPGLEGAFMDPCRHAAFNRAGLPVCGPAVRPMDTLDAAFAPDGGLLVDTATIRPGDADNPVRTVRPWR